VPNTIATLHLLKAVEENNSRSTGVSDEVILLLPCGDFKKTLNEAELVSLAGMSTSTLHHSLS
jgi:hypothetical protein